MFVKRLLGLALLSVVSLGCGSGGPEIASVKGTVKMDGKPLANASVVFSAQGSRPAGAMTDENGQYELTFTEGRRGAIPGKNRVMIFTAADPSETPDGKPIPAQKETVPIKYNTETELEFVVEEGKENIADFNISSEGELGIEDTIVAESLGDDSGTDNDDSE